MAKTKHNPPKQRKDAEIIVKRNFGLGGPFGSGETDVYEGVAIFANRRGYRFLAEYFDWLAKRPIAEVEIDPGDHVHLTPHAAGCDEIDFSFDTLTASNRRAVLRNANIKQRTSRKGSPIRQFTRLLSDMIEFLDDFLSNDDQLRQKFLAETRELMAAVSATQARLEKLDRNRR